jgi:hypothetical protein
MRLLLTRVADVKPLLVSRAHSHRQTPDETPPHHTLSRLGDRHHHQGEVAAGVKRACRARGVDATRARRARGGGVGYTEIKYSQRDDRPASGNIDRGTHHTPQRCIRESCAGLSTLSLHSTL